MGVRKSEFVKKTQSLCYEYTYEEKVGFRKSYNLLVTKYSMVMYLLTAFYKS